MHLEPAFANGHFTVLRGAFRPPVTYAGVKVISDFVDNDKDGLPSEMGSSSSWIPATGEQRPDVQADLVSFPGGNGRSTRTASTRIRSTPA